MGATTGIEWTDATWNPIRGCSRVSEGCRHCYAEKVAYRFSGPGLPYEGLVRFREVRRAGVEPPAYDRIRMPEWNGQVRFVEEHLLDPLTDSDMKKPQRVFVNSMSDLFHESLDPQVIARCFAVVALANEHTFQVLTKRPKQALNLLACVAFRELVANFVDEIAQRVWGAMGTWSDEIRLGYHWPLANVWLGVSVENQATADERIPLLLKTPAAVRFISAEPLLDAVQLFDNCEGVMRGCAVIESGGVTAGTPDEPPEGYDDSYFGLDWVICGGESGPGARPMHPDWARSLRDQCQAAGVPFFFKQWGEWGPYRKDQNTYGSANLVQTEAGYKKRCTHVDKGDGTHGFMQRVGKKAAGALLDGREWREFPSPESEVRA